LSHLAEEPDAREVILTIEGWISHMTDINEQELADQIDREVSNKGGLVALVLCLIVAGGLLIAGAMPFFPAG
jgi:hypothetical protein